MNQCFHRWQYSMPYHSEHDPRDDTYRLVWSSDRFAQGRFRVCVKCDKKQERVGNRGRKYRDTEPAEYIRD